MLTLEERRTRDGQITRAFLLANAQKSGRIACECAQGIQALVDDLGGEYYLKGSNSIQLLKDEQPTGDWDFQFKPSAAVYRNWEREFPAVDAGIRRLLLHVACGENGRDGWVVGGNLFLSEGVQGDKVTGSFTVGDGLKLLNYREIVRRVNPEIHRIVLGNDGVGAIADGQNINGPIVYVNYTIPGFILYRMAYVHRYDVGGEYSLKSELIDISVPRPGSGEVYLAQDGVVTHFRNKVFSGIDFRIPGWGYHFYENMNLLQEIMLGVSGSPDKRQKRRDRGGDALTALCVAPECPENFVEWIRVKENDRDISGFLDTMTFAVDAIPSLRTDLKCFLQERYATVKSRLEKRAKEVFYKFPNVTRLNNPEISEIEKLAAFDFVKSESKMVRDVKADLKAILKPGVVRTSFQLSKEGKLLETILEEDFRIVSPLNDLGDDKVFPLLFVVVDVNDKAFGLLEKYQKKGTDGIIIEKKRETGHGDVEDISQCIRYCFRRVTYFSEYRLEDFLEHTIFESQRQVLAEAFQK